MKTLIVNIEYGYSGLFSEGGVCLANGVCTVSVRAQTIVDPGEDMLDALTRFREAAISQAHSAFLAQCILADTNESLKKMGHVISFSFQFFEGSL